MFKATDSKYILRNRQIILLGDSLTQRGFGEGGWAASLADEYIRKADVINRGLSGYNTRWTLEVFDRLLPNTSSETILAIIWFGANDAAKPDGPEYSSRQHVPVAEFKANLSQIVARVKAYGARHVLLVSPPPVYDTGRKKHQFSRMGAEAATMILDRTDDFTAHYAAATAEVAAEAKVPIVDLYHTLRKTAKFGFDEKNWGPALLCDGLHLTAAGQEEVATRISGVVRCRFPDIAPEELTSFMPLWDHKDLDNLYL